MKIVRISTLVAAVVLFSLVAYLGGLVAGVAIVQHQIACK